MRATDQMIEQAERRVTAEADASLARIRARLAGSSGRLVCDCGEAISEARRRAVPNTHECVACATFGERVRRRA